jgi:hypothetical protein
MHPLRAGPLLNEQQSLSDPAPAEALEALLELFGRAPLVALDEAHWVEQEHALLQQLLLDERFASAFDDVVVEFGNAVHQPMLDRFLDGENIARSELQRLWRECIGGSSSGVMESPVYEAFFRGARRARKRGRGGWPRVLIGDPPFDWHGDRHRLADALGERDAHFAQLVEREVLSRGRRALLLAGGGHFARLSDLPAGNVVQRLERAHPGCCIVVLTHHIFDDVLERRGSEVAELERRLQGWPIPSVASIAGTWLAEVDATLRLATTARRIEPDGTVVEISVLFRDAAGTPVDRVTFADVADAYLYLGPTSSLSLVRPSAVDLESWRTWRATL